MNDLINSERLAQIQYIPLRYGNHKGNNDLNMCVMEAVAYIAGEAWSNGPQCACPVITAFMDSWNDSLPGAEERDRLLKPLIPLIVGTRSTPSIEERRSYMALDWMIRVHTPKWLDMVPTLQEHAKALRELGAIVDMAGATSAGEKVRIAESEAFRTRDTASAASTPDAAWIAAWAAARDAAGDATWATARATARAAARVATRIAAPDAAWAAAWDGAGDAAWIAAWATAWATARNTARAAAGDAVRDATRIAARDALKPTTQWLQDSAVELVKNMCAVKADS
jgi:hypothetical protein